MEKSSWPEIRTIFDKLYFWI